jgi:hypothetical protein
LPIAVTAASDCSRVESGGSAAASTTRTKLNVIHASSLMLRRSDPSGMGNVEEFVSSIVIEEDFVLDADSVSEVDCVFEGVSDSVEESENVSLAIGVSVPRESDNDRDFVGTCVCVSESVAETENVDEIVSDNDGVAESDVETVSLLEFENDSDDDSVVESEAEVE